MTEKENTTVAPKPLHAVRQQLDELDGLLRRMMELPVEPAPEDTSPGTFSHSEGEGAGASTGDYGHPVALESSRQELDFPENTSPSFSDFQFSLPSDGPEIVTETSPTLSEKPSPLSFPTPEERVGEAWAERKELVPDAQTSSSQAQDWEGEPSVWLWPLVALNRAADGCLSRLGRPGRWWQGPWGRACLGFLGLLFLGGALLWGILDWIQWTW